MSSELIINASLPETRIALMEDGEIQELLIERASDKGITGNIYKGRVTRVLPGMQAAFVDIGLEKAAFLYVDDVYVHSEIWEAEEDEEEAIAASSEEAPSEEVAASEDDTSEDVAAEAAASESDDEPSDADLDDADEGSDLASDLASDLDDDVADDIQDAFEDDDGDLEEGDDEDPEEDPEEGDDEGEPVEMGPPPTDDDEPGFEGTDDDVGNRVLPERPAGTIAPSSSEEVPATEPMSASDSGESKSEEGAAETGGERGRRRHRRGRRGGRNRKRGSRDQGGREPGQIISAKGEGSEVLPENYHEQIADAGKVESDRATLGEESQLNGAGSANMEVGNRPDSQPSRVVPRERSNQQSRRSEFRQDRGRDRRIRGKQTLRTPRPQVNIQDLLSEGQEVLVQVAKDPIATKGARLTCHISLPGRHLVCMPTIDHVGVSRRIDRDDERRRLRETVDRYRPKKLGFIVRTASGKSRSEQRIKQDIDYLAHLWNDIREKAAEVTAPTLVYEDMNSVLRSIRDWVTEEIDKVVVDSRYHFNEIQKFVSSFMPSLKGKVELYHGDIPIFDAYGISTELSRALERKVWLKSGGYIVIDQAEALVAIDVNTGRYVGKKNLEDTILKTNLEAVQEIAYQLRLRNCGGIIILDLIDMEKEENKHRVYRALEEALKKDRSRPSILKISELGLVEMTRKRTRDTIIRALCESCSHCEGKGYIKSKQTVAYEVMREIEREGIERDVNKVLVQAHADVIDILAIEERETLEQLERRYRKPILLQSIGDFHPEQFEVIGERAARSDRPAERERDRDRDQDRERGRRGRRGGRGRDRDRGRDKGNEKAATGQVRPQIEPAAGESERPEQEEEMMLDQQDHEMQNLESAEFENSVESGGDSGDEAGNSEAAGAGEGNANASPAASDHDDFDSEEDRLAFMRAQAAQDAALANLNASGSGAGRTGFGGKPRSGGPGRGGKGRGGKWGGGRGGNGGGSGGGGGGRGRRGRRGGGRGRPGADGGKPSIP